MLFSQWQSTVSGPNSAPPPSASSLLCSHSFALLSSSSLYTHVYIYTFNHRERSDESCYISSLSFFANFRVSLEFLSFYCRAGSGEDGFGGCTADVATQLALRVAKYERGRYPRAALVSHARTNRSHQLPLLCFHGNC